ncbi:hypothetical protein B0H11DRAFT_2188462 [Mycena galericulata]|nr:hypothetical protein B0H11DRAFT_2188462 [Mycena galericulata]
MYVRRGQNPPDLAKIGADKKHWFRKFFDLAIIRGPPTMDNTDMNANFCFPISQQLQNTCVKLVPFNTALRAPAFCAAANDDAHTYLPWGPPRTSSPPSSSSAPCPTSSPSSISNPRRPQTARETRGRSARTTSNAAGLLLHWLLDTPVHGGLGQRRVARKANALNAGSVGTAVRMGFRGEGLLRWDRVLPAWKTEAKGGNGGVIRGGRGGATRGRAVLAPNSVPVVLGLCWDEWEDGGREGRCDHAAPQVQNITVRTFEIVIERRFTCQSPEALNENPFCWDTPRSVHRSKTSYNSAPLRSRQTIAYKWRWRRQVSTRRLHIGYNRMECIREKL